MPPERKIEKLLRAYAKRRRTAAGDSLTLTPATRRRLQEALARQVREQEKEEERSLSIWEFFRQQWAFLTAFALAIFIAAALILPVMTANKSKSLPERAYAAKSPAPATSMPMTPPMTASKDSTPAGVNMVMNDPNPPTGNPSTNYLSPDVALGLPATTQTAGLDGFLYKKNETDVVADATFEPRDKVSAGKISFGEAGERAALATVARREILADAVQYKAIQTNSLQLAAGIPFQRADTKDNSKQGGSYQNVAASAKASRVLTRFKVIQNGSDIQIIDGDGSVYVGSWAPKVAQNRVNRVLMNGINQVPEQNALPPAGAVQSQAGGYAQTASQVYSVRVSGDNRTLNQRVVFAGDLSVVLTANVLANYAPAASGLAQNATGNGVSNVSQLENNKYSFVNGDSQQSLWLNSFIVGRATVAGTNQVEVNAISVAP